MNKTFFIPGVILMLTLTVARAQVSATSVTINGTPYLNEAYADGVIHYATKVHKAPIRYNAFQDLIEYQQNGKPLVLDANESIKKVTVGTSTFIPLKYEIKGKAKLGYFELLDSGKMILYAKKKIYFLDAKKGGALDGTDKPAEYKRSADEFYIQVGEVPLQEADNLKALIASLPDKQEEMTQFAKKEKISIKKEKEIIQFVKHYNSLQ